MSYLEVTSCKELRLWYLTTPYVPSCRAKIIHLNYSNDSWRHDAGAFNNYEHQTNRDQEGRRKVKLQRNELPTNVENWSSSTLLANTEVSVTWMVVNPALAHSLFTYRQYPITELEVERSSRRLNLDRLCVASNCRNSRRKRASRV